MKPARSSELAPQTVLAPPAFAPPPPSDSPAPAPPSPGDSLALVPPPRTTLRREDLEVTVVGVGRSGSQIALVLCMLGVQVRIYDGDSLAVENLGVQLYRRSDVGARRPKVRALRSVVRSFVPWARVRTHAERFEGRPDQPRSPLVVIAMDSMAERRALWHRLAEEPRPLLVLDARLGRGVLRLHEVVPDDPESVAEYETSLHEDPDVDDAACTDAATAHAAAAAAALVGGAVCAFVEGLERPRWTALDLDRGFWTTGPLARIS